MAVHAFTGGIIPNVLLITTGIIFNRRPLGSRRPMGLWQFRPLLFFVGHGIVPGRDCGISPDSIELVERMMDAEKL